MRKALLVIICLIAFNLHSVSQDKEYEISLFTNCLQNIDISHPNFNVGISIGVPYKHFVSLNIGMYYPSFVLKDPSPANGFQMTMEISRFMNPRWYYTAGFKGANLTYRTIGSFYQGDHSDPEVVYSEEYDIEKLYADFFLKIGIKMNLGNRFYLDPFAGLGMRYKTATHLGRSFPNDSPWYIDMTVFSFRDDEGTTFYPVIKLGAIIGLKLSK